MAEKSHNSWTASEGRKFRLFHSILKCNKISIDPDESRRWLASSVAKREHNLPVAATPGRCL
jgi:hypothetical protein